MDTSTLAIVALAVVVIVVLMARRRSRSTVGGAQAQASTPYFGPAEIEAYVREHANEIGREMFPDNAEVKWTVRGFTHGSKVVLAEFEPDSEEVGYPSFKFGFIGGNSKTPNHVATYCLEEGVYTLLSTGRGAPSGLPRVLE